MYYRFEFIVGLTNLISGCRLRNLAKRERRQLNVSRLFALKNRTVKCKRRVSCVYPWLISHHIPTAVISTTAPWVHLSRNKHPSEPTTSKLVTHSAETKRRDVEEIGCEQF
jgi:hypothetical protein